MTYDEISLIVDKKKNLFEQIIWMNYTRLIILYQDMASDMCEKNPFYNEDSHMAVLYKEKNTIFLIDLYRDKIVKVSGNL